MATFDAASSASGTGVSSLSWSHTCAASAILVVGGQWIANALGNISGITYNSSALTAAGTAQAAANDSKATRQWYHLTPASGANTVAVTATTTLDHLSAGAVSATSGTTPADYTKAVSSSATTATVTVPNVVSGDLVVDSLLIAGSPTVGADQTQRWNLNPNAFGAGSTQLGANGGVMSWTQGTPDDYVLTALRIPNAGAAASTNECQAYVPLPQRRSDQNVTY